MRLAVLFPTVVYFDGQNYTALSYYQYQLLELRRHLKQLDLITFVRHSTDEFGNEPIDSQAIRVLPLPDPKGGWGLYTYRMPRILLSLWMLFRWHSRDWDTVLLYDSGIISTVAWLLCRKYGLPAILYLGGRTDQAILSLQRNKTLWRRPFVRLLGWWYQFVTPYLVNNTPTIVTGSDLYELFNNDYNKVYKIIASTMHLTDVTGESDLEAREWIPGRLRLLTVCRIVPVKGLQYLLEGVYQARRAGVDVRATIVGPVQDIRYKAQLDIQIKRLGLEAFVDFPGPVRHGESLKAFYNTVDAFVLPSLSEGTPKVIPEALAAGLPIVASAVGGIPELVSSGSKTAGHLVPPKDSGALAQSLVVLAQDVDYRRQLAQAAIALAVKMSVEVQMKNLFNIIVSNVDDHRSQRFYNGSRG